METVRNLAFVLVALLGLLTAGLTAIGGADGHWEHEGSFRVGNAPARVFAWITEPETRMKWIDGLESCRVDGRLEQGAKMHETLERDGRRFDRVWEITEYEPEKKIAMRTEQNGVSWEIDFRVETGQSGRRSHVVYHCAVQHPGKLALVVEPILESMALSELEADFERLEQGAEGSY